MDSIGNIRTLTHADITLWLSLAHESDGIAKNLISDINVFQAGFDLYMESKIRQQEAFMASTVETDECMGIVALSRKNNRVTFLGVFEKYDLTDVGSALLFFAIEQLDKTKDVFATVLNSSHDRMRKEMRVYERSGFIQSGMTIEAGIEALVMQHQAKG